MISFNDFPDSLVQVIQPSLTHGWSWTVESSPDGRGVQMLVASTADLRVEADVDNGKIGKCRQLHLRGDRVGRVRQIDAQEPYVRKLSFLTEALTSRAQQASCVMPEVFGAAQAGADADLQEVSAWIEDVADGDWLGQTRQYPLRRVTQAPQSTSPRNRVIGFITRNAPSLLGLAYGVIIAWSVVSVPAVVVLVTVGVPAICTLMWLAAARIATRALDADDTPGQESPWNAAQTDTDIGGEVGPDRAILVVAERICDSIDALTVEYGDDTVFMDEVDTRSELDEIAATTVRLTRARVASPGETALVEQERFAALNAEREGLIQRVAALFTYHQRLAAAVMIHRQEQQRSARQDLPAMTELAELSSNLPDRSDFYARGVQHEEAATRITEAANQFGSSRGVELDPGATAGRIREIGKTGAVQELSANDIESYLAERTTRRETQSMAVVAEPAQSQAAPLMPMTAPSLRVVYGHCHPCNTE